ncbi:RsfA family transcriptional regulator [Halalkalibacter urbisdiaboli]|uniref:RsfA family transcriptional regulator n=1 Tax=Halalkalibacter urbisdiaboli TaxID=1960589 RepID=UPI000B444AA5|nr:RsfA family transcriptional regulator [Halalkalibacter urbisdiaboli]
MSSIRQDAWSTDEDLILAEVVLRHIREGGTQLAAFEEVGERLSRTSAACGFRWNSTIRKKYESAIALARKQRSKNKKTNGAADESFEEEVSSELTPRTEPAKPSIAMTDKKEDDASSLTMEKVLDFLSEYHRNREDKSLSEELERVRLENQTLRERLNKLEEEKRTMTEDYRALLSIMDRARKLSIYQDSRDLVEPSSK